MKKSSVSQGILSRRELGICQRRVRRSQELLQGADVTVQPLSRKRATLAQVVVHSFICHAEPHSRRTAPVIRET